MKTPRLLSRLTHDLPEEGQLVVYDDKGEKLVVLNEIGAAIYFLIDGKNTAVDIARFVVQSVEGANAADCEKDVDSFLEQLTAEGVVEWFESTQSSSP